MDDLNIIIIITTNTTNNNSIIVTIILIKIMISKDIYTCLYDNRMCINI